MNYSVSCIDLRPGLIQILGTLDLSAFQGFVDSNFQLSTDVPACLSNGEVELSWVGTQEICQGLLARVPVPHEIPAEHLEPRASLEESGDVWCSVFVFQGLCLVGHEQNSGLSKLDTAQCCQEKAVDRLIENAPREERDGSWSQGLQRLRPCFGHMVVVQKSEITLSLVHKVLICLGFP